MPLFGCLSMWQYAVILLATQTVLKLRLFAPSVLFLKVVFQHCFNTSGLFCFVFQLEEHWGFMLLVSSFSCLPSLGKSSVGKHRLFLGDYIRSSVIVVASGRAERESFHYILLCIEGYFSDIFMNYFNYK